MAGEQTQVKQGKRVLIAMDGSKHSTFAFEWYVKNAHDEHDDVILGYCSEVNAHSSFEASTSSASEDSTAMAEKLSKSEEKVKQVIDSIEELAKQHKINKPVERLHGSPGEAIVKASIDKNVDMIVVGSRGLGKLRRTIMGSVSDYIVHHSHVPVIVCKHSDEHQKLK